MKANEVPEKIYLEREKEIDKIHHLWGRTPVVSSLYEHIEYTRTDAFIEKACEWLAPVFKDLAGYYSGAELLDDFKKAMSNDKEEV